MKPWQLCFRDGIAPSLSDAAIIALRDGCRRGDPRLVRGHTVCPYPVAACRDEPAGAACALGYAGWQGEGLRTVAEVEEFFARVCFDADHRLGHEAACRFFLNWFDDTELAESLPRLADECDAVLAQRRGGVTCRATA